jgi:hypothetical protein
MSLAYKPPTLRSACLQSVTTKIEMLAMVSEAKTEVDSDSSTYLLYVICKT